MFYDICQVYLEEYHVDVIGIQVYKVSVQVYSAGIDGCIVDSKEDKGQELLLSYLTSDSKIINIRLLRDVYSSIWGQLVLTPDPPFN